MEQGYIRLLLSSLVTLFAMQPSTKLVAQELPRLVVCISVDQLRGELLKELSPMMDEQGFRRLMSEGLYYPAIEFPLVFNNFPASVATIHTGVLPSTHGITADKRYNRKRGKWENIFLDKLHNGVYTREQVSPKALRVATLGDRLKLASQNSSLVYSIAPSFGEALSSSGVLADGAFWLDDLFGAWATTSFYPSMPAFLSSYNNSNKGVNRRLLTGAIHWTPLRAYKDKAISYTPWSKKFNYTYNSKRIEEFKHSAKVNEEITDLAIKFIENAGYEYRKSPSLLNLSYTLYPNKDEETAAEDVDMYLRLDRDIKRLFNSLEKKVGLKHCLIVVSGTGYTNIPSKHGSKEAYHQLDTNKARALVNMYLSALYGSGQWVQELANGELFLNRELIGQKKVIYANIVQSTAKILLEVEGIASAYSADQLLFNSINKDSEFLSNSIDRKRSADVYFLPLNGWEVLPKTENLDIQPKTKAIQSPLIIYQSGRKFSKEDFIIRDVREIVKVVCQILRIRPPN